MTSAKLARFQSAISTTQPEEKFAHHLGFDDYGKKLI
jgi:hypothetical protein